MEILPSSPFIVRAPEMRARADAAAIRHAAGVDAARIRAEAEAGRQAELHRGREEGLRIGLEQAARLSHAAAGAIEAFWAEREDELHDLAFAIAYRILATLPLEETMAHLAREAIAEHRRDVRLTLQVASCDAPALRAALDGVDPDGRVAIELDPFAAPGACTLIHPRGRTKLSLLDQFRALMQGAA